MSDGVVLNPGIGGQTIATDEVAGVHLPVSKIILGADGVNDGFVSDANPLPTNFGALSAATDSVETRCPWTTTSCNGTAITTATTTQLVAAPSAGQHLVPMELVVSNRGPTVVKIALRHGPTGPLVYELILAQYVNLSKYIGHSWAAPSATGLYLHTDAAAEIYWTLGYLTEAD